MHELYTDSPDHLPVKPEADPRLQAVASLFACLKESEGGYAFIGYASNPRDTTSYWIIHVMEKGKVIHDVKVDRLDAGADFSHNDLTLLGNEVDRLKSIFNPNISLYPGV